jgi:hypothetical protein
MMFGRRTDGRERCPKGAKPFPQFGHQLQGRAARTQRSSQVSLLRFQAVLREDHAAYIGEWLDVLKSDKRAIFMAAAKANEAVQFLMTA